MKWRREFTKYFTNFIRAVLPDENIFCLKKSEKRDFSRCGRDEIKISEILLNSSPENQ